MDNIGDWLYIVFIVIAGVSGLITSGKKKKHPSEVLGHPEGTPSTQKKSTQGKGIWDIFEEVEPIKQKNQKQEKTATKKPFLAGESTQRSASVPSQTFSETRVTEVEHQLEITINNADDLKKAIIYSEILNRKY